MSCVLAWVSPKAEPETKACVQVVYFGGDPRGQEKGIGGVKKKKKSINPLLVMSTIEKKKMLTISKCILSRE